MSDQAANEAQASIGSQDDASTSSTHSKEEAPSNFQKHYLAASWLTAFDRKLYFKDNIEGMQATGAESNSPAFTAAMTDRKPRTSMNTAPIRPCTTTGYRITTLMAPSQLNATQQP